MPVDVPITEGTPLTDLSTPPGFRPLLLYSYPELYQLPPNALTETVSFQVTVPTQVAVADWQNFLETVRGQLASQGIDLVAYAVWEQPATQIVVPDQICLAGTTCLTIPNQLCFPLIGCISLAGSTLVSAFTYQVWVLVYLVGQTAGLVLPGEWAEIRGQIQLAITILLIFFGVLVGVVALREVLTGRLTSQQLQGIINDWLQAPGNNVARAEQGLAWPFAVMGAVMVIGSITGMALAFSGNLSVPLPGGPFQLGGSVGPAPTAPAPAGRGRGR